MRNTQKSNCASGGGTLCQVILPNLLPRLGVFPMDRYVLGPLPETPLIINLKPMHYILVDASVGQVAVPDAPDHATRLTYLVDATPENDH